MNELIEQLARARKDLEETKAEQKRLLDEFQQRDEWVSVATSRAFLAANVERLEAMIYDEALESGEKKPHAAVQVKSFTVVMITDETKAREWCLRNFTPALKLDTKIFEKAAKGGTVPAELVTVATELRAQIAQDLSGYLK